MSLIVEDGTGLEDAESLCSVDDATAYHAKRGVADSDWADLDTDAREALLRKATDYMEQRHSARWRGQRMTDTQALAWPRAYVPRADCALTGDIYWPDNAVPALVANACAELALRAVGATLSPDLGRTTIREKVGPIETQYAPGAAASVQFKAVDDMLAPFLKPATSGAMHGLVRS